MPCPRTGRLTPTLLPALPAVPDARPAPCSGVNEDLGEYLRHLVYDKEQKEYIAWLARVGDFVAK